MLILLSVVVELALLEEHQYVHCAKPYQTLTILKKFVETISLLHPI